MQKKLPVTKPGKQRKMLYNAPHHIRHKLICAPLSPDLISSKGAKTLPVRKGDTIQIVRGDNKGFEGKISRVDLKRYRIFIEGLTREKVDGTNVFISIHPSKVILKKLNLDDRWRKAIVERKKQLKKIVVEKKTVKKTPKATKKSLDKAKIEEGLKTVDKNNQKKKLATKKLKKTKKNKLIKKKGEKSKTIKKTRSKRKKTSKNK
jgi:large subunit ribosomal protein L24